MHAYTKIQYFCLKCMYIGIVLQLCLTLCDSMGWNHEAPLSLEFSRQEYWSGLPFPPPGNLPNPGIKARSCTLWAYSLLSESPGNMGI